MAQGKTNAVRLLDRAGVPYELHEYHVDMESAPRGGLGLEAARKAGIPPEAVFKTLVARGAGGHYVFVVPVAAQLDMKKAAAAVGEKRVELLPVAGIQKATGYIRGGCSPLGMKKAYPTVFDASAQALGSICVSAGRPGLQVQAALHQWEGELRRANAAGTQEAFDLLRGQFRALARLIKTPKKPAGGGGFLCRFPKMRRRRKRH